ncbi:transposable element-derived 1-like [Octopus vulgaris]|uniref:Transposable element-derived 1-like n=1 Tax=Octopus vulgaris TaxID=6645 RepID=A0AA36BNE4_OCTVU|nr:transposable element-derived 1-like [Octopus vulgaris]
MLPKCLTPSKAFGSEPKSQKNVMTLHEKAQLLDMFREGKSYAAVGSYIVVNESTIRYIKKNEVEIRTIVAVSSCETAKKVTIMKNKHFIRIKSAMALWISDCKKENICLSGIIICEKAQNLYQQFNRGDGAEGTKKTATKTIDSTGA